LRVEPLELGLVKNSIRAADALERKSFDQFLRSQILLIAPR
jgi:hypothetical protein